jgi:hypothetical protein
MIQLTKRQECRLLNAISITTKKRKNKTIDVSITPQKDNIETRIYIHGICITIISAERTEGV